MNFKEFATKNVVRNIKAYFAYFLSSCISAGILFLFTMFMLHPSLDTKIFPEYIQSALILAEVISYLFICFFVFYSVSIFLKSRFREFGTLYILGVSKKQLKKMIFIENTLISTLASILGVLFGLIFSKIFLVATSRILDIKGLDFYIPIKAIIITIILFIILGIVISFCTSFIIKEDKVLKLLKGVKKPKKEPKISWALAVLSIILIGLGYFKAVNSTMDTISYDIIPVTTIVIIGTYFLFSHSSVLLIKILKGNKNFYLNKTKLIWVANLFYKIKDNTRMFFLLAITSAIAFSAIGGVYAFWRDKEDEVEKNFPQALFYEMNDKESSYRQNVSDIESLLKKDNVDYTKVSSSTKIFYKETGTKNINIINESTYKKLSNSLGLPIIEFNDGEALYGAHLEDVVYKDKKVPIDEVDIRVVNSLDKRVLPALYDSLFIVKDDVFNTISTHSVLREFNSFNVENYKELFNYDKMLNLENNILSKADLLEAHKVAYGLIMFLAIFIGLVFFVTTGSFLYNKLYMETEEDKKKYLQLNKIGLTFKEIKKISTIEIGVLFLFPYIVAVIHSLFALSALKNAFGLDVTASAIIVMGSFLIIQIMYFLIIRGRYLNEIKRNLIRG